MTGQTSEEEGESGNNVPEESSLSSEENHAFPPEDVEEEDFND